MTLNNPTVSTFNQLAPIIVQTYESYLPTAFDDSLTMLEKVNKIIQGLNSTNSTVNSVIDQWNNTIAPYVNKDGFQTDVNNKLELMANDGTLATLINQDILNSKATVLVNATTPSTPDNTTYWYQDLGTSNVNFNSGVNVVDVSAQYSTTPPSNTSLWYQPI